MKIAKEFKEFALRGNVVDMAVGVIIGAAFGKVVSSLVSDIMMPPLGYVMGGVDFSAKVVTLREPILDAAGVILKPAITLNYGLFINNIIGFAIVAFALFLIIQAMNRMKKKQEAAPEPAAMPADVALLTEIRDLLKK
jgi:large conductance mechanosensitive channel